ADDPRGIAAHGDGVGVIRRLEEHDARIGPARRRAQADRGVAALRDAAVGAAAPGIIAAAVDDHHPGAGDAGVARDREAAALDDVDPAGHRQPGVLRYADAAVDARLDRRRRVATEAEGAVVRHPR